MSMSDTAPPPLNMGAAGSGGESAAGGASLGSMGGALLMKCTEAAKDIHGTLPAGLGLSLVAGDQAEQAQPDRVGQGLEHRREVDGLPLRQRLTDQR